jgi:hypothetical protein
MLRFAIIAVLFIAGTAVVAAAWLVISFWVEGRLAEKARARVECPVCHVIGKVNLHNGMQDSPYQAYICAACNAHLIRAAGESLLQDGSGPEFDFYFRSATGRRNR